MPRQARVVTVGAPHHFTQRSNNRQDVFLFDQDRRRYLDALREQCLCHDVTLLGWCLMSNHVHLAALPGRAGSLAKALGQTHPLHAQGSKRRYAGMGSAWQNRFYSCVFGGDHVARAAA